MLTCMYMVGFFIYVLNNGVDHYIVAVIHIFYKFMELMGVISTNYCILIICKSKCD